MLALPAAEISIARIVRAVDGPLAPLPCASVGFIVAARIAPMKRPAKCAA